MSDDDARAAETTAHDPATEVVPPVTQAAPELAWSRDDSTDDELSAHQPWPRVVVVTLIALTSLIGLAVIGLGAEYFRVVTAKPSAPLSIPYANFTPVSPAAPAPPARVTVTAAARHRHRHRHRHQHH